MSNPRGINQYTGGMRTLVKVKTEIQRKSMENVDRALSGLSPIGGWGRNNFVGAHAFKAQVKLNKKRGVSKLTALSPKDYGRAIQAADRAYAKKMGGK